LLIGKAIINTVLVKKAQILDEKHCSWITCYESSWITVSYSFFLWSYLFVFLESCGGIFQIEEYVYYTRCPSALILALHSLIRNIFSLYFIGVLWDFHGETMGLWIFIFRRGKQKHECTC